GAGTSTLDLSGRTEPLHVYLVEVSGVEKILVGWGAQGTTASFLTGLSVPIPASLACGVSNAICDYEHMIEVEDASVMTSILGGTGSDIFTIWQTPAALTTINGGGGDDTYDFREFGNATSGNAINVDINEVGKPWDSNNQIVIDGSDSNATGDSIDVTDSQITGTGSQTVTYHRPGADKNVLAILVNGNGGADQITIDSTRDVVPVKVDGGAGDDIINVGGGTLSDIVQLARPGVQVPYGVGPVVVVGGAGLDTLIVDDHSDSTERTGTLTSWLEVRQTAP